MEGPKFHQEYVQQEDFIDQDNEQLDFLPANFREETSGSLTSCEKTPKNNFAENDTREAFHPNPDDEPVDLLAHMKTKNENSSPAHDTSGVNEKKDEGQEDDEEEKSYLKPIFEDLELRINGVFHLDGESLKASEKREEEQKDNQKEILDLESLFKDMEPINEDYPPNDDISEISERNEESQRDNERDEKEGSDLNRVLKDLESKLFDNFSQVTKEGFAGSSTRSGTIQLSNQFSSSQSNLGSFKNQNSLVDLQAFGPQPNSWVNHLGTHSLKPEETKNDTKYNAQIENGNTDDMEIEFGSDAEFEIEFPQTMNGNDKHSMEQEEEEEEESSVELNTGSDEESSQNEQEEKEEMKTNTKRRKPGVKPPSRKRNLPSIFMVAIKRAYQYYHSLQKDQKYKKHLEKYALPSIQIVIDEEKKRGRIDDQILQKLDKFMKGCNSKLKTYQACIRFIDKEESRGVKEVFKKFIAYIFKHEKTKWLDASGTKNLQFSKELDSFKTNLSSALGIPYL